MFIVWILIILGVVALDQVSKILVVEFLDRDTPFVILEGIFRFKYSENRGAAFGSFENARWVFMIASVVGIVALSIYLFKFRPDSKLACTALSMIIGGGIGNMIDRVLVGYVVDFFDFTLIDFAVFNVADSFVCIGAGLFVLWFIIDSVKEYRQKKNAIQSSDNSATDKEENTEQ